MGRGGWGGGGRLGDKSITWGAETGPRPDDVVGQKSRPPSSWAQETRVRLRYACGRQRHFHYQLHCPLHHRLQQLPWNDWLSGL